MRRICFILLCVVAYCQICHSQAGFEKLYEDFLGSAQQDFITFSDSINNAFAETLRTEWDCFQVQPENSGLQKPDAAPSLYGTVSSTESIQRVSARNLMTQSRTALTYPRSTSNISIDFYGVSLNLRIPESAASRHLSGIRESDVADFWHVMTDIGMRMLSDKCRAIGDSLKLNDWGILQLILNLSQQIYPYNINSEQVVLSVFLLNQLGLNARIARYDNSLTYLIPARQTIYGMRLVQIDAEPFYLVLNVSKLRDIYTYRHNFSDQVNPIDLTVSRMNLPCNNEDVRIVSKYFPTIDKRIELPVNNMIASFYASYPHTELDIYATAPLTAKFDEAVVERISPAFAGKTEIESVNMLLRTMQNDFGYMTDERQFGYERPFFLEENLIYPYNDCEDRAMLFSYLVRKILGLKTALIVYPGHICAGVCFNERISGMNVRYSGCIYTICDPTCLGAPAGATNQNLTSDKYTIIEL